MKNHCSTNQWANGFEDPRPGKQGQTLNFNYLNYYANPQIVTMPHTVQAYSLLDPAPTYGNSNFSDLGNWTSFLLQQGRPVVFYPETAYWVNFDISVPLFLAPIYALDRVEDAGTIDSMQGSVPLLGQLNFESGWQWGYWLANSVQALTAWRQMPLQRTFQQLLRFVGPRSCPLAELLVDYATAQRRLLIRGLREGGVQTIPAPGVGEGSATGIAYLQGSEGLSDLGSMMARYLGEGAPQPDRLHLMELQREAPASHRVLRALVQGGAVNDVFRGSELYAQRQQWFQDHLHPLLTEINSIFAALAKRFEDFHSLGPQVEDLVVSAEMLSLRASHVLALYEYAAMCRIPTDTACASMNVAKAALRTAEVLVQQRAPQMGLERLGPGGHRLVLEWSEPIPTAYSYGYLWAAHTLFYWHRDQAMVEQEIWDLCFRTINDPVELGLTGGGGPWARWMQSMAQWVLSNRLWHFKLSECLGPPAEPKRGEAAEEAIVM